MASNRNTPVEILKRLATDDDEFVLCEVAANSNTPSQIRKQLKDNGFFPAWNRGLDDIRF